MQERLRILAAAAALGEFTLAELTAFSGAERETVKSTLRRERGLFTEVAAERQSRGRPAKRWALADREHVLAEVRELEDTIGLLRPDPEPEDSESERLSSVLAAEDALLRAWDPDEDDERQVLTRVALLSVAEAQRDEPGTDAIARRARGVETFARLTDAESRGEELGSSDLAQGADALVDLEEFAPERVSAFLRGLADLAVRSDGVLPLAIVSDQHPRDVITGLPDEADWVRRDLPGTNAHLWSERWCERLIDRGLVAGVIVPEAHLRVLPQFAMWRAPKIVLSERGDAGFADEVSRQAAFFRLAPVSLRELAGTLGGALEQTPELSAVSAEHVLDESRTTRLRLERLESLGNGDDMALVAPRESAFLRELLSPTAWETGLTGSDLSDRLGCPETDIRGFVSDLGPVLHEARPDPSSASFQKRRVLRVRREAGVILALDIGPHHVRAARSGLTAELPARQIATENELMKEDFDRFPAPDLSVDDDFEAAMELAASFCVELLRSDSPEDVVGIGLAIAQPIDAKTGKRKGGLGSRSSWDGKLPVQELRTRLGWSCPILPINDANAGLLSEARFGAAKGRRNVWHVRWTWGIGAGGLVDGRLVTGAHGIAGEIGHLPVILVQTHKDPRPDPCPTCKHHCLESVASARAMAALAGYEGASLQMLLSDPDFEPIVDTAAFYVGQALAQVTTLLNPELITIGGEFSPDSYELIGSGIRRGLREHAFPPAHDDVDVAFGERTGRAVLEGSLVHVLDEAAVPYLLSRALRRNESRRAEAPEAEVVEFRS